ncbi:hypothetical protein QOZ80_5AG0369550 [Eleusine coracana subsp. coracana]|uniref:Non-specific lipid-transfer protein n=1 Tax=Eleusine coracana subsp. coracana TaxID=191504 RepID=A0A6G8MVT9_ELECO|nr:hypothetical protein QOZ80_5AG0369550 [Eleusine coracana subsp. coracana]QIN53278.1 NSLTP-3 [Eleusine coracana subsp. coracana]
MAASATPAAPFVLAALLVQLLAPPRVDAAAPSCSTVYDTLMPCLGYVESGGTVPPSCCAGIKQLVSGARTTPDRRAICACLKDLAKAAPAPYIGRAEGLPDRCGVQLGYKLSPDMDCNSIK